MTDKFIVKLLISKMAGRQISDRGIKHFELTWWRLQPWSESSGLSSGSADWTSDVGFN